MTEIVEWEQKQSIYVLKVIDENDNSKEKKWVTDVSAPHLFTFLN